MALRPGTMAMLDNSVGVSDACLLEPLNEDNFLYNLSRRFQHDQIYVSNAFIMTIGEASPIFHNNDPLT